MKINGDPLNQYLIKNLQPLTEADPVLLANYVAALLKNNKPKKELQKLCIEQLYDFLGDGTKGFVIKLFHALEDESTLASGEDADLEVQNECSLGTANLDVNEPKGSPHRERIPSAAFRRSGDEVNEESSDDEDDDRNHKHRRRVSRSRSFDRDRDDDDEDGRMTYRKHERLDSSQQPMREGERHTYEHRRASTNPKKDGILKYERRLAKGHIISPHFRVNQESQRAGGGGDGGLRAGSQFSADLPGPSSRFVVGHAPLRAGLGRGRGPGNGAWLPHEQRGVLLFPDGLDFQSQNIPQGPTNVNFYSNRHIPGHAVGPQPPWSGFTPLSAIGNGSLDHAHPLNRLSSARGPTIHSAMSNVMGMPIPRPRCPDFEERGYCLRGDLCPMEHGANRIVVEDVQSLSKYNLPVTLPIGRSVPIGAPPVSEPSALSLQMPIMGLAGRGSREMILSDGEGMGTLHGATGGTEPDSYDPDQPLFKNEHSESVPGVKNLRSFQKECRRQDWERTSSTSHEVEDFDFVEHGISSRVMKPGAGSKVTETLPSVWDRIGPVDHLGNKLTPVTNKGPQVKGQMKLDDLEEQLPGRGGWQDARGDREVEEVVDIGIQGQDAAHSHNPGGNIVATQVDSQFHVLPNDGKPHSFHRTGGRSSGVSGPRSQRTLYVRCIPTASNKKDLLLSHFQKFGMVLDIRIALHSDRAFVQYVRREDAEKALSAPDAVMGNRFIRLSWANRDNIMDPREHVTSTPSEPHSGSPAKTQSFITQEVAAVKDFARPVSAGASESSVKERTTNPKVFTVNGSATVAPSKKQEELEQMKEEIRRKQEALTKKREDFREKLEKLAKQGTRAQTEVSEGLHPPKRQRLDEPTESSSHAEREGSSGAASSQGKPVLSSTDFEVEQQGPVVSKTSAEEDAKVAATVTMQTASSLSMPKGIKSPQLRGSLTGSSLAYAPSLAWGPARYKLDNRTTVFRVVPPIPAILSDVAISREHFAKFGELLSVEVDNNHDRDGKLTEKSSIQMTFATRRAAERAFLQARSFQGQTLQFEWVNSTNGSSNSVMGMTLRQVDLSKGAAGLSSPNLSTVEPLGLGIISEKDGLRHPKMDFDQQRSGEHCS